jgi:hypothetical protein
MSEEFKIKSLSRTAIRDPKSKICEVVPPNVLARADKVIR